MKTGTRPIQISTLLKTMASSGDDQLSTELESYIADLEARQPERPARIAAILETMASRYSDDTGMVLEAYITNLETKQQSVAPDKHSVPSYDPLNPPIWSYERVLQREQRRRERALKKQNNYR